MGDALTREEEESAHVGAGAKQQHGWALQRKQDEIDVLTAKLCETCQHLDDLHATLPQSVHMWWEEHKKLDKARLAAKKLNKDDRLALLAHFKTHGKLP